MGHRVATAKLIVSFCGGHGAKTVSCYICFWIKTLFGIPLFSRCESWYYTSTLQKSKLHVLNPNHSKLYPSATATHPQLMQIMYTNI